jgi:hypothetical protein
MPKPRKPVYVPPLSDKEAQELLKRVETATKDFSGIFDELESAVGMLMIGRLMGWRALLIIHNKRTIRKYEKILGGIDIREMFPEEGPMAHKSLGLELAKKIGNFWKVVSGEVPIESRRELEKV